MSQGPGFFTKAEGGPTTPLTAAAKALWPKECKEMTVGQFMETVQNLPVEFIMKFGSAYSDVVKAKHLHQLSLALCQKKPMTEESFTKAITILYPQVEDTSSQKTALATILEMYKKQYRTDLPFAVVDIPDTSKELEVEMAAKLCKLRAASEKLWPKDKVFMTSDEFVNIVLRNPSPEFIAQFGSEYQNGITSELCRQLYWLAHPQGNQMPKEVFIGAMTNLYRPPRLHKPQAGRRRHGEQMVYATDIKTPDNAARVIALMYKELYNSNLTFIGHVSNVATPTCWEKGWLLRLSDLTLDGANWGVNLILCLNNEFEMPLVYRKSSAFGGDCGFCLSTTLQTATDLYTWLPAQIDTVYPELDEKIDKEWREALDTYFNRDLAHVICSYRR